MHVTHTRLPIPTVNPDPLHILDPQASGARTNELVGSSYNIATSSYADAKANIITQPPSAREYTSGHSDDNDKNDELAPKTTGAAAARISEKAADVAEKTGVRGTAETLRPPNESKSSSKSDPGFVAPPTPPLLPRGGSGTDVPPLTSLSTSAPGTSVGMSIPLPPPPPLPTTPPSSSSSISMSAANVKKEKASFLDRLKGEVKILSGKMANDGARVEAGKALKNGGMKRE